MKIRKTSSGSISEIGKAQKEIEGEVTSMFKLIKIEGEKDDDDSGEVKPCDRKLTDLVSNKVSEYFESHKQLRKVLLGKRANTHQLIVDDIKKKITSNTRLHQLFDRFADELVKEEQLKKEMRLRNEKNSHVLKKSKQEVKKEVKQLIAK